MILLLTYMFEFKTYSEVFFAPLSSTNNHSYFFDNLNIHSSNLLFLDQWQDTMFGTRVASSFDVIKLGDSPKIFQ